MAVALQMPDPVAWHDAAEGEADEFAVVLSNGAIFFTSGMDATEDVNRFIAGGSSLYGSFQPRQDGGRYRETALNPLHVIATIDLRSGD